MITEDVWWRYDWNDPDVFTTTFDFAAGDSYTLVWVVFEASSLLLFPVGLAGLSLPASRSQHPTTAG